MKIYKITEASEYLGVSINTLKTLANNGGEYKGEKQTVLQRVKVLDVWEAEKNEENEKKCLTFP